MFTDCTKRALVGALLQQQQTIYWIFTEKTTVSRIYRHKPIVTYRALMKCQAFFSTLVKLKLVAKTLAKSIKS